MELSTKRIIFLKVPIDIVSPEDFSDTVLRLSYKGNKGENISRNIVLLSLWDLLRARRNNEYRQYVLSADLVIPISKSIVTGLNFLKGTKPFRYMPFNFIISLLTELEKKEYSVFLLGGKKTVLRTAEKNIKRTFPHLKVVGRFEAYMKKREEPAVIEAIRKSSPSLLLAGKGIRGGELWIAKNSSRLNWGLRIWCSDIFDVFAEKKRRPSDSVFNKGLENIGLCFKNPFMIFRLLPYIRYKFLLLIYKLRRS